MRNNYLVHYGVPRRSGRYPWGSGDRPFQSEASADAKDFGTNLARLEAMKRELTKGVDPKAKILVPTEVKKEFSDRLEKYLNDDKLMRTKYSYVKQFTKSMDDGFDYLVTQLGDTSVDYVVEHYAVIGKTEKEDGSDN